MRDRDDLVFPMAEYHRRLEGVRHALAERELDALVVTTPENLFYLTGYQTIGYYFFQALVVPLDREPFMVTRHLEACREAFRHLSMSARRVETRSRRSPVARSVTKKPSSSARPIRRGAASSGTTTP